MSRKASQKRQIKAPDRVLKEWFLKLGGPGRDLRSCFSNGGDPAVLALPFLLSRLFPFFPLLAPRAPIPPTRLWHKICKKVKKKYFLTKSRRSCTFMKVCGRCAARPPEDSNVLRGRQKSENRWRQKSENIVHKRCCAPPE